MKVTISLAVILFVVGQISARSTFEATSPPKPDLPAGCYDGSISAVTCCDGVDAWYVHLPDPNNCRKFFQCDNGKVVHKDCPANLHWSVSEDKCEWPDKAGCQGNSPNPTTSKPTDATTSKPTDSTTSRPTEATSSAPSSEATSPPKPNLPEGCYDGSISAVTCCDGVDAWYVHLPDPNNCGKFFQCDNGKVVHKDCPAGLHWSVSADRCEWPEKAGCQGNNPTTTQKPEPTTAPTTAVPTTRPTTAAPTTKPPTTAAPTTKPPTTVAPTTKPPTTAAPTTTVAPTKPPTTVAPTTTARPTTTSAPPTTPAPSDDECAPEAVCHQCITGVFPADLCCKDIASYYKTHLANAENCSSYYQCIDGQASLKQCPEGLHWSIESDRCEWPKDAKCQA